MKNKEIKNNSKKNSIIKVVWGLLFASSGLLFSFQYPSNVDIKYGKSGHAASKFSPSLFQNEDTGRSETSIQHDSSGQLDFPLYVPVAAFYEDDKTLQSKTNSDLVDFDGREKSELEVGTEQEVGTEGNRKIVVIPIREEITPATLPYLERAIEDAKGIDPHTIVFEINTFGGRLDTTYQIVDTISELEISSISFVEDKAISAGTLIALASRAIYMSKGSTMGDVAPVSMGADGVNMLGEKFQSPLRAKFRALAEKNGYPVKLSEAFVTVGREIIEVVFEGGEKKVLTGQEYKDLSEGELEKIIRKKTLVSKEELLTMNDREAIELGFSSGSYKDVANMVEKEEEFLGSELVYLEPKTSEQLLRVIEKYAFVLVLIGLAGIYLEVKNPGFGFFGIAALLAFGVLFGAQYMVALADYAELVLLLLGIGLLFVEVFILPGFGVSGLAGMGLVLTALVLMFQDFTIPTDQFQTDLFAENLKMVLGNFLIATGIFILSFFFLPSLARKTPLVFRGVNEANFGRRNETGISEDMNKTTAMSRDQHIDKAEINGDDIASKRGKMDGLRRGQGFSFWKRFFASKKNRTRQQIDMDNGQTQVPETKNPHKEPLGRSLVGLEGQATTDLRPSGFVSVNGKIYDAISEDDLVKRNTKIIVQMERGNSLIVRSLGT